MFIRVLVALEHTLIDGGGDVVVIVLTEAVVALKPALLKLPFVASWRG